MSQNKKRKIDTECRVFNDNWSLSYFFIEYRNKAMCLICNETVAVFKEFNIKRHYESKHQNKYVNCEGKYLSYFFIFLKRVFRYFAN